MQSRRIPKQNPRTLNDAHVLRSPNHDTHIHFPKYSACAKTCLSLYLYTQTNFCRSLSHSSNFARSVALWLPLKTRARNKTSTPKPYWTTPRPHPPSLKHSRARSQEIRELPQPKPPRTLWAHKAEALNFKPKPSLSPPPKL